jgi:hypothetical protein
MSIMLKRTNVYLDMDGLKALKKIGKEKGGLKPAQLIRMAIHEFIKRETNKEKSQ